MKKKILALCLVVVLAVTAVTGVTLAYFTDTDAETNVFTTSNVSIDLKETFDQNSVLMPGKENAVNKDAWIVNDGDQDAYVWAEVLIPAVLDDGIENSPEAPGLQNSLHVNFLGANSKEWGNGAWCMLYTNEELNIKEGYVGQETVGAVTYNKYVYLYETVVTKNGGQTTTFMDQAYMDATVKQCDNAEHKDNCLILKDDSHYTGTWEVIVRAYGIQSAGFDDVYAAYAAYDGAKPATAENGKA